MDGFNWRNPQVELLVLSACRTVLGDREAELGFGGLAVKSGAKSALGSLWYVDDGGHLNLSANLQKNQNFSHPYYWSSFTMIGNPW